MHVRSTRRDREPARARARAAHSLSAEQTARLLEAVLCTVIAKAGGEIRLKAELIEDYDSSYRLWARASPKGRVVTLALRSAPP